MARNSRSPVTGKHRVARRTKIAMGAIGLAIAVGALAVAVTTGRTGEASADAADPSFYIDITKVPAGNNVNAALKKKGAQGSFTVDCGTNADGAHHNPDNFIAQPGIKNGAQHLHDYVGNVTTDADSNLKSLLAGGTTCKNGDKSAYFWPVIRIDREDEAANESENQKAQQQQKGKTDDVRKDQSAQDARDAQEQNRRERDGRGGGQASAGRNDGQNAQQQDQNQDQNRDGQQDRQRRQQNQNQNQDGKNQQNQDGKNQDQQNQNQDGKNQNQQNNNQGQQQEQLGGVQGPNEEVGDNDGEIIEPESAELKFIGGGADQVAAMPLGLRVLYGDAKQSTNGPANARPSWTCTGFEDRLTDLYPICPKGSKVERIHAFPNCWDGKNTDSENHRTHIVFADRQGKCPQGFKNVPQLQVTLVYDIPQDVQQAKQYKVDAFAQEKHNPRSDHDDFANVMSRQIMGRLVNCINSGKVCAE
ncbi:DUF1996 domain-containing protein [Amycolatopsis sp. NEAU-NG30]|uniref:DUF1996 domain-containing protein n=1 Tax=Amycolatopsis melonis TaxID=3156488 RepID=A0ABV0L838_9PSEU